MPGRVAARVRRERPHFSTAEAFHLIEEISEMRVPLLALTGNDPLSRPDLFPVIEFASGHAVRTSLTLRSTPKLEGALMAELKQAGLMRVAFWLHGSTPALDDAYWGVSGAHRRILDVIGACHEVQLAVQVNTIVARRNFRDIDPMFELLTRLDVALWNVFFFVPASPEQFSDMLTSDEHEQVFAKLYAASKRVTFQIKTTEGQHYQRFVWQQRLRESRSRRPGSDSLRGAPKGLNDSRASVFINYAGEVCPSRFLPLSGGNVTTQSLAEVYRDSALLVSLRDSSRLKGKCGRCEMRQICGGSRPRAYAVTGDLFAEEPCCAYQP
jgi:radical SAM protein with 4Fe4S-binding SPASM domain